MQKAAIVHPVWTNGICCLFTWYSNSIRATIIRSTTIVHRWYTNTSASASASASESTCLVEGFHHFSMRDTICLRIAVENRQSFETPVDVNTSRCGGASQPGCADTHQRRSVARLQRTCSGEAVFAIPLHGCAY